MFQLELDEEKTKIEEKEEVQCSSKVMVKEHNARMYITDVIIAVGRVVRSARCLDMVTSQIAEVSSKISEGWDKIKTEVDELKDRLRELQLNWAITYVNSICQGTTSIF